MKTARLLTLCLPLALTARAALACDFCMIGQGVSPYLTTQGRGVTLDIASTVSDHIYDGATGVDAHGKTESWLLYTLTGFYAITDDASVLVGIPYAEKTNLDYDATTQTNPGEFVSGLGDITVSGRYTFFRDHTLTSTLVGGLIAGLKLPTGATDIRDIAGNPVDRHALPGTGSFDGNFGFTGSYATGSGFQLTADAMFTLSGPGSWAGRDHQFGNSIHSSIKAYYRVIPREPGERSLMPFVGISQSWMGTEKGYQSDSGYEPDTINLSSGGTELFADVGLYGVVSQNAVVSLTFSKAFYHLMNYDPGFDPDPAENYRLDASVSILF